MSGRHPPSPPGIGLSAASTARRQRARPRDGVGLAVLGCGYWGVNYLRLAGELAGARLVAVCDQRAARLAAIRDRFPHTRLTTRLDDVLADPAVEAVIVCTQARDHHSTALRCLRAGRHVLVEKPLTTRSADADELLAESEGRALTLMVGHTFLFNAGVQVLREYVARGALGRVYYLHARRTSLGPIRHDVNAAWDLASHDVAIFSYLLEAEPEWVSAVGASVLGVPNEDVAFVSLGYPGGIVGHVHVSWVEPNKVREVVVVGSDRRIVFNDLDAHERVRVFDKGVAPAMDTTTFAEHAFQLRDGPILSPLVEVSEPLKNQLSHFIACIGDGSQPRTDGRLGRSVVRVMEGIDRSMARSGAPIRLGVASANGAGAERRTRQLAWDSTDRRRRRRAHPVG